MAAASNLQVPELEFVCPCPDPACRRPNSIWTASALFEHQNTDGFQQWLINTRGYYRGLPPWAQPFILTRPDGSKALILFAVLDQNGKVPFTPLPVYMRPRGEPPESPSDDTPKFDPSTPFFTALAAVRDHQAKKAARQSGASSSRQ